MLAERLYGQGAAFAESWNFGSNEDDARTVSWVAKEMSALWGNNAQWIVSECEEPCHETVSLTLDVSKARARLNWYPVVSLHDALQQVVEWAKQRRNGADVRNLMLSRIHDYQELLARNC